MRDKRLQQERELEEAKSKAGEKQESVEERKARLAAQRDLLRKQMEEKRQQELVDFNKRLETKAGDDLYSQFKKMDQGKKTQEEASMLEKRRMIYSNLRKEIEKDE